ncbi:similar to peptidoglycan binding domain containing protein [Plenodomus lingam JN3]|uniref:Similar to peptidoglycan binding domain containing protein n=2 Tax=Leptosphaeria maculans TaxID=5022 RepID=E4ZXA3_LEPMJ|nr:similar to peptidoglycan binding domain containing protein [Plenodomus lingam JN3]CBX95313.1 similar to peptidoglycan binding domain containing protein [Plenodomus lingam JN3]
MPAHTEIWTLIPDLRGLVLTLTDPYVASLGFDRPQPVEQGCWHFAPNMDPNTPWRRRLVVCCDGTWQSSVSTKENAPSNVTKLCRLIARIGQDKDDPSQKFHQIVYYDSGIGTGALSSSEAKLQGGTGAGLAENVIEAYNFIVQNFEEGDEIFCFGFSRGAYTARAVAGLVGDVGIIRPTDMQFFPELYRLYMTNDEGDDFRKTKYWSWFVHGKLSQIGEERKAQGLDVENIVQHDGKWTEAEFRQMAEVWEIRPHKHLALPNSRKVKVVGVFDTVGSLGIPDMIGLNLAKQRTQYGFHNVRLTGHIEHAYQALALDERRRAFRPTLWYIPDEIINDPNRPTPELKQVWFPGVHINCGGGSDDCFSTMKGDSENISTATLCWMLQCISPHLTIDRTAFEAWLAQYKRWLFRIRYACTYHHEGWGEWALSFVPNIPIINPGPSELAPPRRDPPHRHSDFDFGWGTGRLADSYTAMYHLNGSPYTRQPGHERVENYDDKAQAHKWTPLTKMGPTNEYIHPIVHHRSLTHGWDAHSPLKDKWNRDHWRGKDGNRRFWWYKDGERETCALPEWAILPNTSDEEYNFERKWYSECEKSEKTLGLLKKAEGFGDEDFLTVLDRQIDFGFDAQPQTQWP